MHYYKRNIGDYAKKAGRLSMLQHGAYTLLMDACYDREKFPSIEDAIEWTWASTTEEIEAVKFVLHKFFKLENGLYTQNNIQEIIAEYHGMAATNKRIAIDRETKRKEKSTNRAQVDNESSPNQEPLTTNHKPVNNKEQAKRATRLPADWNPSQDDIDYCKTQRPDLQWDSVAENFRDYWIAKSGSQASKLDWSATWRSWVRKESAPRNQAGRTNFVNGLGEYGQKTAENAKQFLKDMGHEG